MTTVKVGGVLVIVPSENFHNENGLFSTSMNASRARMSLVVQ